jgi:prepilin-type N-terminal cleavage/methylation domain-containing protein
MPAVTRLPSRRRHRPAAVAAARGRGAFTLVELVLVVAAVAILSAIAVPRYASALARYRVDLAAKRVAADLTFARSHARAKSTPQVVDFSTPTNGYTLTGVASPDGGAGEYIVRLGDEPYKAALGEVAFGDPASTAVWFDRFGAPDHGGIVVVTSGGFERRVALDAVTGKAVVQ